MKTFLKFVHSLQIKRKAVIYWSAKPAVIFSYPETVAALAH